MASKPPSFKMPDGDYAGDTTCREAWDVLRDNADAVLVDVRTQFEWQLIGKPDLSSIDREPIFLQWVTSQGVNENFTEELRAELDGRGTPKGAPVYFMCQSGGRSKIAAQQAAELGYSASYNIAEGFEGDLDEHQHRNSVSGWKVAGLPWTQN